MRQKIKREGDVIQKVFIHYDVYMRVIPLYFGINSITFNCLIWKIIKLILRQKQILRQKVKNWDQFIKKFRGIYAQMTQA